MGLDTLANTKNPNRSLTRRIAELLSKIDRARRNGWTWDEIASELRAAEGLEKLSAKRLRDAYVRARRLVEDGKVRPDREGVSVPSRASRGDDDSEASGGLSRF